LFYFLIICLLQCKHTIGAKGYFPFWEGIGRYLQELAEISRYWMFSAETGWYWQVLEGTGRYATGKDRE
jgi:hypothetical protein